MADNDEGDRPRRAAWTYLKPRGGFSKGTRQGVWVCAVLLALLFLTIFVFSAPPGTAQAVFADVVLGLLIAVAGVWVVGGMIELDSTLYDIGIKAGGGIAILLFVTLYFRPIYFSSGQVKYDENHELGKWGTIGIILTHYEKQFSQHERNAIHLQIPDDIREKVLNFRADPTNIEAVYNANWGVLRRNPKLRILDEIEKRQECLFFEEEDDKVVVKLQDDKLKIQKRPEDGATIYLCKP